MKSEDDTCRICFGSAYENGMGRLISPCMCTGTMQFVHVSCLNEWRTKSTNPNSMYSCQQCNYKYNMERTQWATLLESNCVLRFAVAMIFISVTLLNTCVLAPFDVSTRFFSFVCFDPRDQGKLFSLIWTDTVDMIFSGLIGVAFCGVILAVKEMYNTHQQHMLQSWLFSMLSVLVTNDVRIYRVFAVGGILVASKHMSKLAEDLAKQLLTRFGTCILDVQR